MHIGFLSPEYPHDRTSAAAGIGTSIKNTVIALQKKGIKVSVFIYGQKEDAVFMEDKIKFHLIRQRKFKLFSWYRHRKFLQNYLNKHIALDKIDAVEAPDWTGITAFMIIRCPLVIRFHGSDAYFCKLENRPQKTKNFWFEKVALNGADHLLSVSSFTAEETRKIFNLRKEIKIIPNSVDVEFFKPQNTEIEKGGIFYFGSIIRKKGVLELAQIFNLTVKENPHTRLLIAGKDVKDQKTNISTRKLMEQTFSSEALKKVNWLGSLPYSQILEKISKANVVIFPSFAEALPMTWIEAMAMEKALVTSDIGWAKEVMVNAKTGFTVDPNDHQVYADKILQLLEDPALAERMGKAARERILEKFSTEVVVEENISFYRQILARPYSL